MPNKETKLTNEIILALDALPDVRCWRSNTGSGWPTSAVLAAIRALRKRQVATALKHLINSRPISFGVPGQADITGICRGRRLEVEVKTETGTQQESQKRFEEMIRRHGGIYILARSKEDALSQLEEANYGPKRSN